MRETNIEISTLIGHRLDAIYYNSDISKFINQSQIVQLKEICVDFKSGIGAGKQDQATKDNGILQIRPTNIDNLGFLKYDKNIYVPKLVKFPTLETDDILFNNTNSQELVGKTAIFKEKLKSTFSNHITRIRVDKTKIIPDYLWIILNLYQEHKIFSSICTNWNNQSGIGIEILKSIEIPLLKKELQHQIVDLYECAYTNKHNKERHIQELLDRVNSHLLAELGIFLPQESNQEKYFEIKISQLIGNRLDLMPYKSQSMALLKSIEESPYFKCKLNDIISESVSGDWGIEETDNYTEYTKCLVIRATEFDNRYNLNIENSRVKYRYIKNEKLEKMNIKTGDLLLEKSGGSPDQPVGRIAMITNDITEKYKIGYSNFIHKLSINPSHAYSLYIYHYLKVMYNIKITESMQSQTNGIRNLIMNTYFNQTIILPEIDKQKAIADHISLMLDCAYKLEKDTISDFEKVKTEIENIIIGN